MWGCHIAYARGPMPYMLRQMGAARSAREELDNIAHFRRVGFNRSEDFLSQVMGLNPFQVVAGS